MKRTKLQKLKEAGWKSGTVQDFLALTDTESALVEVRVALFEAFQKMRKEKKLTQQEAAQLLNTSQSRISKLETGDRSVTLDLMIRSLVSLGAKKEDFVRIFK